MPIRGAIVAVISSGQSQVIGSGQVVSGVILRGGSQIISSGGFAKATVISSGGRQIVGDNAFASGTIVDGGGTQTILSGGFASATIIDGGEQIVAGGEVLSTTIVDGRQIVGAQTNVFATNVGNKAVEEVHSGGFTHETTVHSGGCLILEGAALADFSNILRGGTLELEGGLFGGTIASGAREILLSGNYGGLFVANGVGFFVGAHADLTGTTVESGTVETIKPGGIEVNTTILGGGSLIVSGGSAGGTIDSGGKAVVNKGALQGATIEAGATAVILSGGTAENITLSGGQETIRSGGLIRGETTFGAKGVLHYYGAALSAEFAGFAASDRFDLASFAFDKSETLSFVENSLKTRGTLTVSDGAMKATITVFGQYVAAGFHIATDHVAGSVITYSPPTSSTQIIALKHG
jgi:autotransporter passenger strand-loop-strand repeat protein